MVACPNQDVAYGFGLLDARTGPSVIQIPDFGDRFWVYQIVDQRTDSFAQLGAMYGTKPGMYLLAPGGWDGVVPDGIGEVFRFDTRIGVVIPRVFLDDTDTDRAEVLALVDQIGMYPLAEFTGTARSDDWVNAPTFPSPAEGSGAQETQWVDPTQFFDQLREVMGEVPPRPGEQAVYAWITSLLDAAAADPHLGDLIRAEATDTNATLLHDLFEFRNIGIPINDHWSTQHSGARFGTDYLSRTAMGKANIFVNLPTETTYFYQDLDADGQRLHGSNRYTVTFLTDALPPVRGFWSLTLCNEHHFFHANDLDRYSLGTKNNTLHRTTDGSLTLHAGATPPPHPEELANWLPAPNGPFSLYIRSYWPEKAILDGTWTPPAVQRVD